MKTNRISFGFIFLLVILIGFHRGLSFGQTSWFNRSRRDQNQSVFRNLFLYETYSLPTYNRDRVRFIFFSKISNDLLQFVHSDTTFHANYELAVTIKNSSGESVAGKIIKNTISTVHYSETNSRELFSRERFEFFLSPGEYTLFIELTDNEIETPYRREEKLYIQNFLTESFTVSKILFYQLQEHGLPNWDSHFPSFPPIRSQSDSSFWAKFYICSYDSIPEIRILYTLLSNQNKPVFSDSTTIILNNRIQPINLLLNQKLSFGQYFLSIKLTYKDSEAILKSPFFIRWGQHPTHLLSLKQAIDVLQYIMDRKEWNTLVQLPKKEQEIRLERFWKDRDPDPDTEVNELENEFYQRIASANRNFSSWKEGIDGWKTDRGRIYIIHGSPTDVERPPSSTEMSNRYEIWYYSHLNKRFVFLDRHHSEDYKLISEE